MKIDTSTEPTTLGVNTPRQYDYTNMPDVKRFIFLRKGLLIGIALELLFLFGHDLREGSVLPIVVSSTNAIIFSITYILSIYVKKSKILFNFATFTVVFTIAVSMYGPSAPRSIFFAPVAPIIAYLFLSRLGGVIWTLILTTTMTMVYFADRLEIFDIKLQPSLLIYGVLSSVVISALLYVYEGINVINEKLVSSRGEEIHLVNKKLEEQLVKNSETAKVLAKTLSDTQKNNDLLHDSKLALMNVLEDSNNLQNQLRAEKEGIEKTIAERTTELQYEQTRLRASINSLASGFLMTFKDEQEAIYNPALFNMFNLNETAHFGMKTNELIMRLQEKLGSSVNFAQTISESEKTAKPFAFDKIAFENKSLNITGAPILLDNSNEILGCVILIDDNTEEMQLERSKDEFLSIASHELRTPLTVIRGNASMLESMYIDSLPDDDSKTMLKDIKASSVRLIGIVNQFLSTSRLEQKRMEFVMTAVDIKESIHKSVDALQSLADEKQLKLMCELPESLPLVMTDDSKIQEVIVNLISNAIKYTEKGSVTIKAFVVDNQVEVDVIDTGIGIEHNNKDLLFHKFQQATNNILTRDPTKSTGLGLYITKLLIEDMNGKIYLKSSEFGKGSVFTFMLPIAEDKV